MCRTVALFLVFTASAALAQERGFRVHRYEGTAAGTSTFLVDRPWYTSTRGFSAGLTGDYSHRALPSLLDHAVVGHVDIAGALFDRLQLKRQLAGDVPRTWYGADDYSVHAAADGWHRRPACWPHGSHRGATRV